MCWDRRRRWLVEGWGERLVLGFVLLLNLKGGGWTGSVLLTVEALVVEGR